MSIEEFPIGPSRAPLNQHSVLSTAVFTRLLYPLLLYRKIVRG
jgi:hypothetical protein